MARFEMSIAHGFGTDEALPRIKPLLEKLRAEHGSKIADLAEEWDGNLCRFRFSVRGYAVSGTLIVETATVVLSGDLPWQATIFKGRIETAIREQAATLLA